MRTENPSDGGYSKAKFDVYGCHIDRNVLDRLLSITSKNFSSKCNIQLSTVRKSGGISSHIFAASVDELLARASEATAAGDASWIGELDISVRSSYDDTDPQRVVNIYISRYSVWGNASGSNSGWVRGKAGEIDDFLKSTRSKWALPPKVFAIIAGVAAFLYLAWVAIFISIDFTSHPRTSLNIATWFILSLYATGWFIASRFARRSKTKLMLTDGNPPHAKDWIAISTLIATVLILVATVVGTIYTLVN